MKGKTKILIVLNGEQIPSWQQHLVENLQQLPSIELQFLALSSSPNTTSSSKLVHWHIQLDKKIFHPQPDAFALNSLPSKLEIYSKEISKYDFTKVDFIISFSATFNPPFGKCKKGVFYFTHGEMENTDATILGYWEMIGRKEVLCSKLNFRNSETEKEHTAQSTYSMQSDFSTSKSRNEHFWKLGAMLSRAIQKVVQNESCTIYHIEKQNSPIRRASEKQIKLNAPNNLLAFFQLLRHGKRLLVKGLRKFIVREQWILLIDPNREMKLSNDWDTQNLKRLQKITPPKDVFWADPFLVPHEEKNYLFLEELPFATNKGHLSVMELNSEGKPSEPVKILDLPYHLSYPFIFQHEEKYYMIPESAEDRSIQLYECTSFPYQWRFKMNLMSEVKAFDSTIYLHNRKYWLFVAIAAEDGMGFNDELYLYFAERPDTTEWKSHPMNPIVSDVRYARPAGHIFEEDGKIIRPSQDCSLKYGYGLNWMEIEVLSEKEYREKPIKKLRPTWDKSLKRTHTFNRAGGMTVMDAIRVIPKFGW